MSAKLITQVAYPLRSPHVKAAEHLLSLVKPRLGDQAGQARPATAMTKQQRRLPQHVETCLFDLDDCLYRNPEFPRDMAINIQSEELPPSPDRCTPQPPRVDKYSLHSTAATARRGDRTGLCRRLHDGEAGLPVRGHRCGVRRAVQQIWHHAVWPGGAYSAQRLHRTSAANDAHSVPPEHVRQAVFCLVGPQLEQFYVCLATIYSVASVALVVTYGASAEPVTKHQAEAVLPAWCTGEGVPDRLRRLARQRARGAAVRPLPCAGRAPASHN